MASSEALRSQDLLALVVGFQRGIHADMKAFLCLRAVPNALFRPTTLAARMLAVHVVLAPWRRDHGLSRVADLVARLEHTHALLTQYAVYQGDLGLLGCLHAACDVATVDSDLWDLACLRNQTDVLRALHEWGDTSVSIRAVQWACEFGHVQVVQFLHETIADDDIDDDADSIWTPAAMDVAAANGHLDVVAFLHRHRTEGCTTNAMDQAAAKGHLDVVEFLHENRSEGCTVAAMNLALSYDHWDVVQWLHLNRTEGCTTQAMDLAACDGRLDAVAWLHTHRPEGCTQVAMDGAAAGGHLHVVQYLHAHALCVCSRAALSGAVQHGRVDVAAFLRHHGALTAQEGYVPRYHI
ncbi:hypothetical protein H310_13889 [Aphanomyces invadans]|uniref:Uncharacterized protein n=1 Tax=Aphanomyces invadans TaxID=157072 RepID=A0A024TC62_9STRA|nr:hypothetical protein H310_13889 [Aphanomyces invadans]ETV91643.1 hypothetical protein H310_13889 [Aphanomyces invadans]|eukprot:XP_008879762.1 hypothetical protein H310_13889 [Aphanomyces invadans]